MTTSTDPVSFKRFRKIYVEISNICNLQCSFCPEVEREKKIMGEDLFAKIIADIADLTEEVCFHLMGEPLAHPLLARYVEICAEHALPINITTNGVLLDDARSQALLHPIVRQVNFSLHSFADNFPEREIKPYLNRIFAFTRRAFQIRPDLYLNYRLWNIQNNSTEDQKNREILHHIEQEFVVSLNPNVDVALQKSKRVSGRLYLHFDSRFDWPSLKTPWHSDTGFCYALSAQMAIHADGTVVPCCLDKEAGINLGNCQTQAVQDILATKRVQNIKAGFSQGKRIEDLCQRCHFIDRFKAKPKQTADHSH